MSEGNNTNTLVLLMIAGGLYYIKNAANSTEKDKNDLIKDNDTIPYVIAFILVFSIKKEIEETISKERIYTTIAITAASYLTKSGADIIQIFGSIFATLIMLPAIQQYEQNK